MDGDRYLTSKKSLARAGFVFTLTDAVLQAAQILDIDTKVMAAILQTDAQSAISLTSGNATLAPERQEEWKRATDFVRLYCMLERIEGNRDSGRQWLRQPHPQLRQRPIDVLLHVDGLRHVLHCIQ
jgi:uncharacterized protein (DUF2384 family)